MSLANKLSAICIDKKNKPFESLNNINQLNIKNMIIDLDFNKQKDLVKAKRNYIILDVKKFQYKEDKLKFKNAIEVLDVINTIHWINEFYKSVNSNTRIDNKILYKCIDASFSNKPFTNEDLKEYYKTSVLLEDFFSAMLKFQHLENFTPYELEFVLFGFTYDEQSKLTEDEHDQLCEDYGYLFCDVRMRNLGIEVFINRAEVLINNAKELIKDK